MSNEQNHSDDEISARRIFGQRADRYAEMDVFSEEKYYRPILEMAAPEPGERVLDLATGTGLLALLLSRTASKVTAVDVTPEMLARAQKRIAEAGVKNISFLEAEAASLPFPGKHFDLVTCRTAFHHFPDPRKALAETRRVLVPGGRFVMEDVCFTGDDAIRKDREQLEHLFDSSHVICYRIDEIEEMLRDAGLTVEKQVNPLTQPLPLELILRLNMVEEEERRAEIEKLVKKHIGTDLGGFRIIKQKEKIVLQWVTFILTARRFAV